MSALPQKADIEWYTLSASEISNFVATGFITGDLLAMSEVVGGPTRYALLGEGTPCFIPVTNNDVVLGFQALAT
jgi:hypothetical protein